MKATPPWTREEDAALVQALCEGALGRLYPSRAVGGHRSLGAAQTRLARLRDRGLLGDRYRRRPLEEEGRRAWTTDEKAALERLAAYRVPAAQIGEVLGRTEAAVLAAIHNSNIRRSWARDLTRARTLIADGATVRQAAKTIGRTYKALARKIERERENGR